MGFALFSIFWFWLSEYEFSVSFGLMVNGDAVILKCVEMEEKNRAEHN